MKGVNETWLNLTTPISSFFLHDMAANDRIPLPDGKSTYIYIPALQAIPFRYSLTGAPNANADFQTNWLAKLVTFGSEKALHDLNVAYYLGNNFIPYSMFTYTEGNSYYLPYHLDAASVLLYGYSWLINLPAKYFDLLDTYIDNLGNDKSDHSGIAKFVATFDIIVCILSLFVEFPLAVFNTIAGFFVGLFCHPLISICAIPGMFYFGILTTISALFGVVWYPIMCVYHLFT